MHLLTEPARRLSGTSKAGRRAAPLLVPLLCTPVVAITVLQPSPTAAASPAGASTVAQPAAASPVTADLAPARGVWPLQPRPPVLARFDPPADPWGSGHRGVDLGGQVGEPVHAAAAGVVTFAGRLASRGVVVVDHGATRTTYEPVVASVHVGDRVAAGAVIGLLQLFGSHCFPRACLHWGLIEGRDHYLDPLSLVGAAPVRLLPLGDLAQQGTRLTSPRPMPPQAGIDSGRTVPGARIVPGDRIFPGAGTPATAVAAYAITGAVLQPAMALAVQARGWAWR